MPVYQLVIRSSDDGPTETVQFDAADPAGALTLAHRYPSAFPAELWQDGNRLFELRYSERCSVWKTIPDQTPDM